MKIICPNKLTVFLEMAFATVNLSPSTDEWGSILYEATCLLIFALLSGVIELC